MKHFLYFLIIISFVLFGCGKKDTTTTDTKKETQKTETKQETTTPTSTTDGVKLPADFPLEDETFKKATVTGVSESMGLITVTFKTDDLPDDLTAVMEKELSKKGFKKSKEEKISDNFTEYEWSAEAKKIGLDVSFSGGKRTMVAVYYERAK